MDDTLTQAEAARRIGCCREYVRQLVASGRLASVPDPRARLVLRESAEKMLSEFAKTAKKKKHSRRKSKRSK